MNSLAINILNGLMMNSLNFFLANIYCLFDIANQKRYKIKKRKINEI